MIVGDVWEGLQSFGLYQGIQTIFVEFQGCKLICKACKNIRWRVFGVGEYFNSIDLLKEITMNTNSLHINLCGGEPLDQEINSFKVFLEDLNNAELVTTLWTNGTKPIYEILGDHLEYVSLHVVFRPPSSREVKKNIYENVLCTTWEKDVCILTLRTKEDFKWAKSCIQRNPLVNWLIVPMLDSKDTPIIIDKLMEDRIFSKIGIQFPIDRP